MGCADIAQRLMIPALLQMQNKYEVIAVASRNMEKAVDFATRYNCEPIVGYEHLLQKNIDAVYMPLPTGLHKEWVNKAILAGKHVYAEKSIAMNGRDANEMVNNARKGNVALMEGYMFQYHQQHHVVKQLLSAGEIGEIRLVRASFGFPPFKDINNFRYDSNVGGGAIKDVAGYVWRCINFLCGNCFSIKSSNIFCNQLGVSIYGSAFATMADKCSAEISYGFDNFYQCNYEIWGSKGKLICVRAFTPKPNDETHIIIEKQEGRKDIVIQPFNHFVAAMDEFYRICKNVKARKKHYTDIVFQAEGLDKMEELSKM